MATKSTKHAMIRNTLPRLRPPEVRAVMAVGDSVMSGTDCELVGEFTPKDPVVMNPEVVGVCVIVNTPVVDWVPGKLKGIVDGPLGRLTDEIDSVVALIPTAAVGTLEFAFEFKLESELWLKIKRAVAILAKGAAAIIDEQRSVSECLLYQMREPSSDQSIYRSI
jgi:hypothetical protein